MRVEVRPTKGSGASWPLAQPPARIARVVAVLLVDLDAELPRRVVADGDIIPLHLLLQGDLALELDLVNATCSRELQLPYKDEHERLRIMELHGKAQEVINCVNDTSMELLRVHFESGVAAGKAAVTLEQYAREHAGDEPHDFDSSPATLCRMHAALVSSTDMHGAVQTFYPLTDDEQYQLACCT